MTPGARVAAAIGVLDIIRDGAPAERALTNWARGARYAGSGDRAAVRDHVFAVLRCWSSCAVRGGGADGRALLIGALREAGVDPGALFTGCGHDPAPLSAAERASCRAPTHEEARDMPGWLWPRFAASLGEAEAEAAARALRHRAPITLRVNVRRLTRSAAANRLAEEGIATRPVDGVDTALQVTDGERRIAASAPYRTGEVELQDAASQAAMAALDVADGARVLDYCAGGGGKTLALAARCEASWFAHDAVPRRMADLPARADRAGVRVQLCETSRLPAQPPFDMVLCDVPCSGSGTWRRAPETKWRLTEPDLEAFAARQHGILSQAAALVAPGGVLVYCTCSVLAEENEAVIDRFTTDHPSWRAARRRRWPICDTADGFFLQQLVRGTGPATPA